MGFALYLQLQHNTMCITKIDIIIHQEEYRALLVLYDKWSIDEYFFVWNWDCTRLGAMKTFDDITFVVFPHSIDLDIPCKLDDTVLTEYYFNYNNR